MSNIIPHDYRIGKEDRNALNTHRSFLIWFTGLSGSGKSTVANAVESKLFENGVRTYVLDGDNIRNGINKGLTFSPEDRKENIRRVGEIANLFVDAGMVVLAAFVSPYREDRENVKAIVGEDKFVEIYVNTSIEECEKRDVKGLYKKARRGEIKNLTGIDAPYEAPLEPTLEIDTASLTIEEAVSKVLDAISVKLNYE